MIEKLPDVPFWEIWRRLSYEDRCSLRRACKQLKSLVDRQIPQNLFLFLECYPCHQILFHSGQPVYYSDSCRVTDFDRFISNQHTEKFRRIKKLAIFFEGLYQLKNCDEYVRLDWTGLEEEKFFREAWHLKIDLEHLNAFEQVEHLEIGEISEVVGQLRLKNLKVLSVETRWLSEFDLDCPQLRAMCISYGARPNFIDHPHSLDYLSTRWILSDVTPRLPRHFLHKLFEQCPKLSAISAENPACLLFILEEVNAGRISLPFWRIIQFEHSRCFHSLLTGEWADCLIERSKSLEPDGLRITINGEPITLEQFLSIAQNHKEIKMIGMTLNRPGFTHPKLFLKENRALVEHSRLFSFVHLLMLSEEHIEVDENLVVKMKHMQELYILSILEGGFPQIDETLFRKMLTTWTKLQVLSIADPVRQIGQRLLEKMPDYWPNMKKLTFGDIPEDFKFVAKFKNLMYLGVYFDLPKEETMFLMQACPSLHHIHFQNDETKFDTFLRVKTFGEQYCNIKEILRKRYSIDHQRQNEMFWDRYIREFDSLEQLVDLFHDFNLFNQERLKL